MSDDLCGVFVTDVHDLRYNYEAPNTRNIKKKKKQEKIAPLHLSRRNIFLRLCQHSKLNKHLIKKCCGVGRILWTINRLQKKCVAMHYYCQALDMR